MPYIEPLDPFQKNRLSHMFLQYGLLEVINGAFVLTDANGTRVQIPIGFISTLFLEPGTTVTHAAMTLASESGTQVVWVGEGGTRTYAAGRPSSGDAQRLLHQLSQYADISLRTKVAYNMYELRFGGTLPSRRSIEQLRGIEGTRVRSIYQNLAKRYNVPWKGRDYDRKNWESSDLANRAISAGNACLSGLCEAVVLAIGYSPTVGFIHTGQVLSFIYDIADLYKMDISVPLAFELAGKHTPDIETKIRHLLRDYFKEKQLVERIARDVDSVLMFEQKE